LKKTLKKKLISYSYIKTIVPKDKIATICKTISNDINLKYHEVACIPMYRDIVVFQKDNKTKAILKVCFECGMNALTGKFESNFNYKATNMMSNYYPLYKTLYKD
jgi:hypothetical protein